MISKLIIIIQLGVLIYYQSHPEYPYCPTINPQEIDGVQCTTDSDCESKFPHTTV